MRPMGATLKKHTSRIDAPRSISIREFSRQAGALLQALRSSSRPAVITDRGRPVGLVYGIDPDEFEDFVLEHAPEYVEARQLAERELTDGTARRLSDVVADLEGS
jgi:hypothetical protein